MDRKHAAIEASVKGEDGGAIDDGLGELGKGDVVYGEEDDSKTPRS